MDSPCLGEVGGEAGATIRSGSESNGDRWGGGSRNEAPGGGGGGGKIQNTVETGGSG